MEFSGIIEALEKRPKNRYGTNAVTWKPKAGTVVVYFG